MSDRFTAYLAMLAQRDAALVSLAAISLTALLLWLGVRRAVSPRTQDRLLALGVLVYYLTLLGVILGGRPT